MQVGFGLDNIFVVAKGAREASAMLSDLSRALGGISMMWKPDCMEFVALALAKAGLNGPFVFTPTGWNSSRMSEG